MRIVEVFKTNVALAASASRMIDTLQQHFPAYRVNFDLHDCDNVLRVESHTGSIDTSGIMLTLSRSGYFIAPLPD